MANSSRETPTYTPDTYEDDYAYYDKRAPQGSGEQKARPSPRKPPKRRGSTIGLFVIIAILIILVILLVNPGFRNAIQDMFNPQTGYYREYPEWADFVVERRITVSPYITTVPMDYSIDLPTPEDIPNASNPWLQNVRSVVTSPNPDSTETKYGGYEWMVWEATGVNSARTFSITYSIRCESVVWDVESSSSGVVADIPQWLIDKYGNSTVDEWKIIPDHPQITSRSAQLMADKPTVYDKVLAIFEYLNYNFQYSTVRRGEPKYCNQTLNDYSGDCDDQSVLFIALARAANIPSWLEFGALYNYQTESWEGHAWVRVYIPSFIQGEGHVYNIDIVNDHFLFRDAYRFSEWESDGNGTHLKDYYFSYGSNFQYAEQYITKQMETSSKTVKIGDDGRPVDEVIPGFDAVLVIPAVVLTALILFRRRRYLD